MTKESKAETKPKENDFSNLGSISIVDAPAATNAPQKAEHELLTANGTALTGAESKTEEAGQALLKSAEEAKDNLVQKTEETKEVLNTEAQKVQQEIKEQAAASEEKAKEELKKAEEEKAAKAAEIEQAAKAAKEEAEKAAKEAAEKIAAQAKEKEKDLAAKIDEAVLGKTEEAPAEYTVKKGDSLWAIARNYKLKVEDIKKWNGMSDSSLKPGMVLKLKEPAASAEQAQPEQTKTAETTDKPEAQGDGTYTVVNGDTYYSLGKKFGLSADKLKELNDGQELKAGQVIKVRE